MFLFFLVKNRFMYELLIDKVIGEDWWEQYTGVSEEISARHVREVLAAFPAGESEVRIVIDSPGGDVFEGITIFNLIRDFARNHPDVTINTYIQGMAASMASVIALAANSVNPEKNVVVAEDNSVYMIHNAWGIVVGNANDMREGAEWFGKVDDMLRAVYVRKTGKSDVEIRAMMDAETWLWGNEILDGGFADAIIQPEYQADIDKGLVVNAGKDCCIHSAKATFDKSCELMRSVQAKRGKDAPHRDYAAAAKAWGFTTLVSSSNTEKTAGAGNEKGAAMTAEELKKAHPDVFNTVMADGEKAGVCKEQARVNRLLAMGERAGCTDYALECIRNGADPADEKVVDAFFDKGKAAQALAAQAEDEKSIPDVNPPKNDKNADNKAMCAAFDSALKSGGYDDGDD